MREVMSSENFTKAMNAYGFHCQNPVNMLGYTARGCTLFSNSKTIITIHNDTFFWIDEDTGEHEYGLESCLAYAESKRI